MGSYAIPADLSDDQKRAIAAAPQPQAPAITVPAQPMPDLGQGPTRNPQLVNKFGHAIPVGRVEGIPGKLNPTEDGTPGTYNPVNPHLSKIASLWSDADNIHNPFVRVLAKIGAGAARAGDAILGAAAPRLAGALPGTTLNHTLQEQSALKQKQQTAQTGLTEAQTREANDRADVMENPPQKEEDPEKDAYDFYVGQGMNPGDAYAKILETKNGGKQDTPEQQAFNSLLKTGMSPQDAYATIKKAGQSDKPDTAAQDDQKYERIVSDRLQGKKISPEDDAFAKAYKDRKTLGQRVTNFYAQGREERKADAGTKQATYKAFQPAMDSAERFNVMTESAEKALKDHDQQAMVNLLANHLGMTMGLQKGARLNQAVITEAEKSQPWLQGLTAKFDKDGYLSGVVLTPQQIKQMVNLGRSRFSEDVVKSRNESKYLGATDDGPGRTANKATIRYYLGQANGDVQKAKQMAAEDGWSLE